MSLDNLKKILSKIRYVCKGDFVLYTDHNYIVDALKEIEKIIQNLENRQTSIEEKIEEIKKPTVYGVAKVYRYLSTTEINKKIFLQPLKSESTVSIDIKVSAEPLKAETTSSMSITGSASKS